MILIKRFENELKLKPQSTEDLWHLEKIIAPGDQVSASTLRLFKPEGSKRAERKPVFITVSVEKVEFHKHSGKLRVLGKIIFGKPEDLVQIGSFHTLELDAGDIVAIKKQQWHAHELERIKEAQKASHNVKLFCLILDERDAELFSLQAFGISELGTVSAPSHRGYKEESKELANKYYSGICELLAQQLQPDSKLIIAGPGFERDNFLKFLKAKDAKLSQRCIIEAIGNTGREGVLELLQRGSIDKVLAGFKLSEETKLIDELVAELGRDTGKVTYGKKEVELALQAGAVSRLLVLDSLLIEKRAELEPLLELAEKSAVKTTIISHENDSSKKLAALGGIAAMLRFKI